MTVRGAVGFESSWRRPMSKEAEGARPTTQRDDYKRRPRCRFSSIVPLGRLGTPEEIAKVVVFLPSDDRSYVTATELFVEGGFAQV
jgi:NAD(P)-dependent dehydrogenase (short-subunit alcohol dehydrogenase family)